jgi:hypothetical protein
MANRGSRLLFHLSEKKKRIAQIGRGRPISVMTLSAGNESPA